MEGTRRRALETSSSFTPPDLSSPRILAFLTRSIWFSSPNPDKPGTTTRAPPGSVGYSPSTVTLTRRGVGDSRCSQRKIPCQVPSCSRPSEKGIVSLVRVRAILM